MVLLSDLGSRNAISARNASSAAWYATQLALHGAPYLGQALKCAGRFGICVGQVEPL
jgi:hypothetical protein